MNMYKMSYLAWFMEGKYRYILLIFLTFFVYVKIYMYVYVWCVNQIELVLPPGKNGRLEIEHGHVANKPPSLRTTQHFYNSFLSDKDRSLSLIFCTRSLSDIFDSCSSFASVGSGHIRGKIGGGGGGG